MVKNKRKVFVGLSGGVDSSVSAALLQKDGFDVTGVFIKVWQPDISLTGGCTWRQDRLDAMRVCAKLGITFYTLDLEKEYKKEVVDYMISEYKNGRTPNPDVMCNKYVKFGGFFDWAMKNGADYVATGHYAKIMQKGKIWSLLAGDDKDKDQSYFLWTLTQKQLSKTFFPIGDIEKTKVRILAKKFGLLTAKKKDSQGLCFIGKVDMLDFLKEFIPQKTGNVLTESGEIIGTHDGIYYYTIGQRHGFIINKRTNLDVPYYVIKKDFKHNTLIVATEPITTADVYDQEVVLNDVSWTMGISPNLNKVYSARIRYRQPLERCQIREMGNGKLSLKFNQAQQSPTPGQSVVIYDRNICLGGGIIE